MFKTNVLKLQTGILILMLLCFVATQAQHTDKFTIEIAGGPGYSFVRGGSGVSDIPDKWGFTTGIFSNIKLNQTFSIFTGFSFDRKGCTYPVEWYFWFSEWPETQLNVNYDYFTMPLLFRATFDMRLKFFVNAGVFGSVLNSCIVRADRDYVFPIMDDYTKNTKSFDYGISTGIGIILPIQRQFDLTLEVRNNLGLANIGGNEFDFFSGRPTVKTNFTGFLIGFSYKPDKKQKD